MKIKAICEKTGLSDRTVRYYIEEGLVSPYFTENYLGRKSFDFSEQDLEQLKSIATLRAFGFTVQEVKEIVTSKGKCEQIVDAVKQRTFQTLDESKRRINALSLIDQTENVDLTQLAKKLESPKLEAGNESIKLKKGKLFLSLLSSCIIFIAIWSPLVSVICSFVYNLNKIDAPIVRTSFIICAIICVLPSMLTLLILKITNRNRKVSRIILIPLCILCLPLGTYFSAKSVIACNHNYEEYRIVAEPTCDSVGENIMKCRLCGDFKTKEIEKLSHVLQTVRGTNPTCLDEGISDGIICSLCDYVFVSQSVLPKIDEHIPVTDAAVPATCKDTGLTEGSHCSVCNKVLIAQNVTPKGEHIPVTDAAVAATCKDTGLTEGSHCAVCQTAIVEQKLISATGHIYVMSKIEQTCGTNGCLLYKCDCGNTYVKDIVRATNLHDFRKKASGTGFFCNMCGLEVAAHGTVDGSSTDKSDAIQFYITDAEKSSIRTMVIYGNGDMPDFADGYDPAWINDYLKYDVRIIIIESGVTSIGDYAFFGSFYEDVDALIIRSKHIRYDERDYSFAGINIIYTKIIYDY